MTASDTWNFSFKAEYGVFWHENGKVITNWLPNSPALDYSYSQGSTNMFQIGHYAKLVEGGATGFWFGNNDIRNISFATKSGSTTHFEFDRSIKVYQKPISGGNEQYIKTITF
jgi:hypothetical protein